MREPVSIAQHEQHEPLPAPAQSLLPRKGLREPDQRFLDDLAKCIRSGVRPMLAAQWLGISRKQFKAWRARQGPIYDELRSTIASARAHLEVKLMTELTRRSPGQALKGLRRQTDDEPEGEPRRYDKTNLYSLKKVLPDLLRRIDDPAITDLSPVESAAREWKEAVVRDAGGNLTTAKLALITSATGSWIILNTIDAYILELAQREGLTSRKHRKAWPIVETRARLAESFARQLQMIGLEKQSAPPMDLNRYIAERYGSNGDMPAGVKETE